MTGTVGFIFWRKGQKSGHQVRTNSTGTWGKAQDWRLLADVGRQLQVPQCIDVTAMRPDMVMYSLCVCVSALFTLLS